MKRKFFRLLNVSLIGFICFVNAGCTKDENSKTMSDDTYYKEIAYCLSKCYSDIYNQNLAGKPVGNQNINTSGPMGGNVIITGSTTHDNTHEITTTDLLFTMNEVKYSTTNANLTQNGATTYKGSFSPTYNNTSHLSNDLQISGTVTKDGITRNVNLNTSISINVTKTTVSATINGHNVNW